MELFNEIDEDQSGFIDKDEVAVLAKHLGQELTEDEVDAAMAEMDEVPPLPARLSPPQ